MSSPEEQPPFEEPLSPIGRMQLGLAALFITPSPKKNNGDGDQFVDDKPFIDERKPLSTTSHNQKTDTTAQLYCTLSMYVTPTTISCQNQKANTTPQLYCTLGT